MGNREIKFRGLRTDTNEWVYGTLHTCVGETNLHGVINTDNLLDRKRCINKAWILVPSLPQDIGWTINDTFSAYSVIPETVGEYTGLKDKHGKDVYEGDIIKFKTTRYHTKTFKIDQKVKSKWFTSPVLWHEGSFLVNEKTPAGLYAEDYDTFLGCFFMDSSNKGDFIAEIVGNIHQPSR